MSKAEIELSTLLLKELYGEIVQNVGTLLLKKGSLPLCLIAKYTNLKLDQVKKALCTLIQHHMVRFELSKRGFIEYTISSDKTLLLLRYPSYTYTAKTLYGDAAELIVEELLQQGQICMSLVTVKVSKRLNDALKAQGEAQVKDATVQGKFKSLVDTQFIQRCPHVAEDDPTNKSMPALEVDDQLLYKMPRLDGTDQPKRRKSDTAPPREVVKRKSHMPSEETKPDEGIYWRLNSDRFNSHIRDQAMINAVASKLDKDTSEVLRTMLRLVEVKTDWTASTSHPLSSHEIYHQLPKNLLISKQAMDQHLTILTEDSSGIVKRAGDMGGGTYIVDFKQTLKSLAMAHIECVVRERFGSKSLRIFRLLVLKKQLEQKQIEEYALIPAKEAKEMLYRMFEENFVSLTEVSKTADHAPSRTFYLFSVHITQVCRMLLERCYQAAARLIMRRHYETKEHRRLLDKQQRVEAIAASLEQSGGDDTQRAEIEEMITPPEREQLAKAKKMTDRLEQSELQIDDTVLILKTYLNYDDAS